MDPIAAIFADGTDGFYYDFSRLSKLWQNTAGTTPVAAAGDNIARSDDSSPRGNNATQATTAAQPKWQTGGIARFDGSDDNVRSSVVPATSGAFIAKFNGSTASRAVLGAGSSASDRCYLAIAADGKLAGGIGNDGLATIIGGADIRNTIGLGAITLDGSLVKLYCNGVEIYSAAQNGVPTTSISIAVGGIGSTVDAVTTFHTGDIYHALAIKKALAAAEITAITNKWGTS